MLATTCTLLSTLQIESLRLCYVKCLDRLPESLQAGDDDDVGDYALQEASQVEHEFFKKLKVILCIYFMSQSFFVIIFLPCCGLIH